jgi:4-amino-4-deoxy-L-arabinose transferase-like glycosyltransferase
MSTQRSIGVYRRLSALYPKSFRAEYGDDLVATFTEHLRDEAATRVWLSTIRDLAVTVPTQHLEARMNHPESRTVAVVATVFTVAALVLAVVAGTGPVVGVFFVIAVAALVVATLAWKAARPASSDRAGIANRWRTILIAGVTLLAAVLVFINVPPYNNRELPEAGWILMMLSLVASVALITVGLTMGIARRSARHATTS